MGLLSFLKKQKLLELQRLVVTNAPHNKLVLTEEQLLIHANNMIQRQVQIIDDSKRLIDNTVNPEVFFKRYDLLKEKAEYLIQFTPYIKFKGIKPKQMLTELNLNEQAAISKFLQRYYVSVVQKTKTLKTEKAKKNQFTKYYDSLQPYYDRMNEENIHYIEERKP